MEVGQPVGFGQQAPPPSKAEIDKLLAVAPRYGIDCLGVRRRSSSFFNFSTATSLALASTSTVRPWSNQHFGNPRTSMKSWWRWGRGPCQPSMGFVDGRNRDGCIELVVVDRRGEHRAMAILASQVQEQASDGRFVEQFGHLAPRRRFLHHQPSAPWYHPTSHRRWSPSSSG